MKSLPSQYNINVHRRCALPSPHSKDRNLPPRRQSCRRSTNVTAATSATPTPATSERDEWVTSVRKTTGRVKHRLWAPHVSLDPPPLLSDITVVLVSPKRPSSVGSVARALSCFECVDLRLVNPRCDHLARSARNGSKGAQYLLWRATTHETLEDAIEGASATVAFTRWLNGLHGVPAYRSMKAFLESTSEVLFNNHQQQQQQQPMIESATTDQASSKNKLVLVFGREEEGLRPEEVTACSAACSIPIGRLQESLSLSHAVSLVLAPLFEARQESLLLERGGGEFVDTREDFAVGVQSQDD